MKNLTFALITCLGAGVFVACGDDAEENVGTAGSSGRGGTAGRGGSAGQAGSSGSAGNGGGAGNGGNAGSSAGSAGQAGSGGTGGSAGGGNGSDETDAGVDASTDASTDDPDAATDAGPGTVLVTRCFEVCVLAAEFAATTVDAGETCSFDEGACENSCTGFASLSTCQSEFLAYQDCLIEQNSFVCTGGQVGQAGCNTEAVAFFNCNPI